MKMFSHTRQNFLARVTKKKVAPQSLVSLSSLSRLNLSFHQSHLQNEHVYTTMHFSFVMHKFNSLCPMADN